MSNFPAYTTKTFSPTQKFFVLDPNTGNPAFVQGSDLVAQLTPNSSYVYSESTRTTAQATDYAVGALVQTAGATTAGDNFAAVYLVVAAGEGDFPMDNGNELLVIAGDELLREQLASFDAGDGSDLVAHTGTTETVTETLDQHTDDINKRTIYVGSVAELEALSLSVSANVYLTEDGRAGGFVVKSGTPPSDPQKGIYIVLANGNYAERKDLGPYNPKWFGAKGDGVTDDTAAIQAADSFGQPFITAGDYLIDPTYEIFKVGFMATDNVNIIRDGVTYNVSGAVYGMFAIKRQGLTRDIGAGPQSELILYNALDDINIAEFADGANSGDSHRFFLTLDVRDDGHSLLSAPVTQGASSDILFRTHAFSDTFYINSDPTYQNERLAIAIDLTEANADGTKKGSYSFDNAITIPGNTQDKEIQFQALPVRFERAVNFDKQRNTILYIDKPGNYKIGTVRESSEMRYLGEIIEATNAYGQWHARGSYFAAVVTNTGLSGHMEAQFEWKGTSAGTTITRTVVSDTLPAGVSAQLNNTQGNKLAYDLDFDDTAGSGSSCRSSISVDFSLSAL